ncbi:hypothetical protein I6F35_02535 [Bradyrhizobium sp. BRP22]|uniref:hypothetical protein n=1 Tax=Bradyrhizobium sp. BRP22 TaxID=2793821 RepID=UPI001CD52CE4|nr:hypothetical protein [Bradyrhizobium sp. BRP22]MCA1452092.1 hypothetical protein [Bradyrhizobium sp. BRP22]
MAARKVWIYEGRDTFKMFVSEDEAQSWLKENDPEGIVIEQQISERRPAGSADQYGVPKADEAS